MLKNQLSSLLLKVFLKVFPASMEIFLLLVLWQFSLTVAMKYL